MVWVCPVLSGVGDQASSDSFPSYPQLSLSLILNSKIHSSPGHSLGSPSWGKVTLGTSRCCPGQPQDPEVSVLQLQVLHVLQAPLQQPILLQQGPQHDPLALRWLANSTAVFSQSAIFFSFVPVLPSRVRSTQQASSFLSTAWTAAHTAKRVILPPLGEWGVLLGRSRDLEGVSFWETGLWSRGSMSVSEARWGTGSGVSLRNFGEWSGAS